MTSSPTSTAINETATPTESSTTTDESTIATTTLTSSPTSTGINHTTPTESTSKTDDLTSTTVALTSSPTSTETTHTTASPESSTTTGTTCSGNKHGCDVANRGECVTVPPNGYRCQCVTPFQGNGRPGGCCLPSDFGVPSSASSIYRSHGWFSTTFRSKIIALDINFPINDILVNSFYVTSNGLIVFLRMTWWERYYANYFYYSLCQRPCRTYSVRFSRWRRNLCFRFCRSLPLYLHPSKVINLGRERCLDYRYRNRVRYPINGVFAAYWTRFNFESDSSIEIYKVNNNNYVSTYLKKKLQNADVPDFENSYIITFDRVGHINSPGKNMSFAIIIGTDYKNTYAFVIFDDCKRLHTSQRTKISIGFYLAETAHKHSQYFEVRRRNKRDFENVYDLTANRANRFGSHSNPPQFLGFQLSNNGPDYVHPVTACRHWLNQNSYNTPLKRYFMWWRRWSWYYPQYRVNWWCPRGTRFISMGFTSIYIPGLRSGIMCFQSSLPRDRIYGLRSICCYNRLRWHRLYGNPFAYGRNREITSGSLRGVPVNMVTRYDLTTYYGWHSFQSQLLAYNWCCSASTTYCLRYRFLFPTTYGSLVRGVAGWRGDPHITTLDGLVYSFNGHGIFELLFGNRSSEEDGLSEGFRLIAKFETSANVTKATMTTGLAIQSFTNSGGNRSTIVEFVLDSDRTSVETFFNKKRFTNQTALATGILLSGDVNVRFDGEWFMAAFGVGVTLKTKRFKETLLIDLMIDKSYAGNTSGLLGNYNDDKADDIRSRNGSILLSSNATDEEIFPIGMSYAINCSNAEEALFHYNESHCLSYFNSTYRPRFMREVYTIINASTELKAKAERVCGSNPSCLFDLTLTGDTALSNSTRNNEEEIEEASTAEKNKAPVFHNNITELRLETNTSGFIDVTATDPDKGDSVTLSLSSDVPWITLNGSTLLWTNVSVSKSVRVSVVAIDSRGLEATLTPNVQFCQCQNNATCQWASNNTEAFFDTPCECDVGWSGRYCQLDEDGCASGPCFSTCTDVPASSVSESNSTYICDPCPSGFEGDGENCTDVDECSNSDNNCEQLCTNTEGSFQCACNTGFTSVNNKCFDIDECRVGNHTCDSNSTCENLNGGYKCSCRDGYHNVSGQCYDIDECIRSDSLCSSTSNSQCTNTLGSYKCKCMTGYYQNASGSCIEINECQPTNPCGQRCIDRVGRFECACETGFTLQSDTRSCVANANCTSDEKLRCRGGFCAKGSGSALHCVCPIGFNLRSESESNFVCENVNECLNISSNACQPVKIAVCHDTSPGYSCSCPAGYKLIGKQSCQDIDECYEGGHNCNLGISACVNMEGSFSCHCNAGYTMDTSTSTCIDIDECNARLHNCPGTSECQNTNGSFVCKCRSGFEGNGTFCEDVDECNSESLNNCDADEGKCINTLGSFSCTCNTGYEVKIGSTECVDQNECNLGSPFTGCWNDSYCRNLPGTYRCSCPPGMELKSDQKSCEVISRCPINNVCGSVECAMSGGEETCVCPTGTAFNSATKSCDDIDECAKNGDILCPKSNKVRCVNTDGSFKCECLNPNFNRLVEKRRCIDIDECLNSTLVKETCNRKSSIPTCSNRENGFDCICGPQYNLNMTSEGQCEDLNECKLGTQKCDSIGTCVNLNPGYLCRCPAGYQNSGTRCVDIDECSTSANTCDHICRNTVGSFVCSCRDGYRLESNRCLDINECQTGSSKCEQICTNTLGSYTCSCNEGFQVNTTNNKACNPSVPCSLYHGCSHICAIINNQAKCFCLNDSYSLQSDQKTCRLIDGAWSSWKALSSCSKTCGIGKITVARYCTNPAPVASGKKCLKEDGATRSIEETKEIACSVKTCKMTVEESLYSVYVEFKSNVSFNMDVYISHLHNVIQNSFADILNDYCHTNSLRCCGINSGNRRHSSSRLVFVESKDIGFASDNPNITGTVLTISTFVTPNPENAVCKDIVSISRRRKRRAATPGSSSLSKEVLYSAFQGGTLNTAAAAISGALASVNIYASTSLGNIRSADNLTTTQATPTELPTPKASDTWIIPVSVCLSLLAIGVIVVVLVWCVVLPKKKSRMAVQPIDVPSS